MLWAYALISAIKKPTLAALDNGFISTTLPPVTNALNDSLTNFTVVRPLTFIFPFPLFLPNHKINVNVFATFMIWPVLSVGLVVVRNCNL